jgi:hypothetical protein
MDVYSTNWNEADASNLTAAPDGWPEGMMPSGVNDSGRAMMGATKRYVDQQIPLLTGGTSTAYTLAYAVAPGQIYDGMTHLVRFHTANGAAATLNVNALGAKPLYCYGGSWGAAPIGMLATDQIARVAYNAAAGAYFLLDLPYSSAQTVSGVSSVDFTGIPAGINHLQCVFELKPGTNNVGFGLQFYGSGGTLDSGSNYYGVWSTTQGVSITGTSDSVATTLIALTSSNTVDNGSAGFGGDLSIAGIQNANYTKVNFRTGYQHSGFGNSVTGTGARQVAGPITGLRFLTTAGTFSGKITLVGSV